MEYNFLILSLIFLSPGSIIYALRKDLRRVIHIMAFCSMPFAVTERYFYPHYWEPVFLFNLIDIIGFGIEDILFLLGLSAFTSTAYAFFTKQSYRPVEQSGWAEFLKKCLMILIPTFLLTFFMVVINVSMIFGSLFIMIFMSAAIIGARPYLLKAGIYGGLISLVIYTGLCLLLTFIYPGIFRITWHTDQFLNLFILGVPVEEILYAFASGMIATVFYPFVSGSEFCRMHSFDEK
jgi:hypothetical protein